MYIDLQTELFILILFTLIMLLLFYYWFHWSLTNSGCLCYWQEPSPFIWYCVPLLWYLLHFGSLKLKGELWKRFSFPSDKIFLFLFVFTFFIRRNKFLRFQFCNDSADPVRCKHVYLLPMHKDSFFSELCVSTNSCILCSTVSSFFCLIHSYQFFKKTTFTCIYC